MTENYLTNLKKYVTISRKEIAATNYLLFNSIRNYLFLLIPLFVGTFSFYSYENRLNSPSITQNQVEAYQGELLENYFLWLKFSAIITSSILISYKWVGIMKDGSYGYWLSLGMERERFFIVAFVFTFARLYISILLSFLIISFTSNFDLDTKTIIMILLLQIVGLFNLLSLSIFLSELVNSGEVAGILLILSYGLHLLFRETNFEFINMIIIGELNYDSNNAIVTLFLSLSSAVAFFIAAQALHKRNDIRI